MFGWYLALGEVKPSLFQGTVSPMLRGQRPQPHILSGNVYREYITPLVSHSQKNTNGKVMPSKKCLY